MYNHRFRTIESARAVYAGVTDSAPSEIEIEVGGSAHNEWLTTHLSCREALQNYRWIWFASGMYKPMQPFLRHVVESLKIKQNDEEEFDVSTRSITEAPRAEFNPLLIYDDITSRRHHGLPIDNTSTAQIEELYPLITHMALMVILGSTGISRDQKLHALPLKAGRLLDYILEDLKDSQLSILSAHDTTCNYY